MAVSGLPADHPPLEPLHSLLLGGDVLDRRSCIRETGDLGIGVQSQDLATGSRTVTIKGGVEAGGSSIVVGSDVRNSLYGAAGCGYAHATGPWT